MTSELFSGHTPREQFIFFNHSVWFASAFVLHFSSNWILQSSLYITPYFGFIFNLGLSFAHWSNYNAKSLVQIVDIVFAAIIIILLICETILQILNNNNMVDDYILYTFIVILFISGFIDVYHERLTNGYTSHITGTIFHFILRASGIILALLGSGCIKEKNHICTNRSTTIIISYIFLCQIIHCILSYGLYVYYVPSMHITIHIISGLLSFTYMSICSLLLPKIN